MALPPEQINIKRRREEEPVETLCMYFCFLGFYAVYLNCTYFLTVEQTFKLSSTKRSDDSLISSSSVCTPAMTGMRLAMLPVRSRRRPRQSRARGQ